jgi:hypothetical protein
MVQTLSIPGSGFFSVSVKMLFVSCSDFVEECVASATPAGIFGRKQKSLEQT